MSLRVLCGCLMALFMTSTVEAAPQWIAHASKPGADTAERGLSRFDQLFLQPDGSYRIPYPISRLVEHLAGLVDNGAHSGVRRVLVPIGRSLQRRAAAPDYFRLPREIISLEGEPVTAAGEAGRVLESRLFIAHQPKTHSLEIISYNDAMGRFEFQVVDNYRVGAIPGVRPAKRAMCLSCHQNAAPLFARIPWSETNANRSEERV